MLIHLISQTAANTAKMLFLRENIETSVRRAPTSVSRTGCGYCLRVDKNDIDRAIEILRQNRIKQMGIYEVDKDSVRRT